MLALASCLYTFSQDDVIDRLTNEKVGFEGDPPALQSECGSYWFTGGLLDMEGVSQEMLTVHNVLL